MNKEYKRVVTSIFDREKIYVGSSISISTIDLFKEERKKFILINIQNIKQGYFLRIIKQKLLRI